MLSLRVMLHTHVLLLCRLTNRHLKRHFLCGLSRDLKANGQVPDARHRERRPLRECCSIGRTLHGCLLKRGSHIHCLHTADELNLRVCDGLPVRVCDRDDNGVRAIDPPRLHLQCYREYANFLLLCSIA